MCNSRRFWAFLNDQHPYQIWIPCNKALKQSFCLGIRMPFHKITHKLFEIAIQIYLCNPRRFWALLNDHHPHQIWIPCENTVKRSSHVSIRMPFPEIICKLFWIIVLISMCNSRRFWAVLNDQHPHQIWISCNKALKQSSHLGIRMPFPEITCKLF